MTESVLRRTFGRTPFDREIVRLAVPALGALAADPLVSLVDTVYVGRLGTTALGSLAVAAALFGIAFGVFNFLQYGTTPTVARELARGDGAEAGRIATSAAALAIGMGVVLATVLVVAPHPLLRAVGAGPELLPPATTYLRIRALALPAVLLVTVGHGVFRGAQDTRTPLLLALGLNAVNLVLDPLLIFGLDMGLAGAAWATFVAQWLGALGFALALHRKAPATGLRFAAPALREIRSLATAGRDLVFRTAALLVAFTASTSVAARLGPVPVAAHQVAFQLYIFLSLSLDAVAIAAQAMLGKSLGEGDPEVLRQRADRLVGVGWMAGLILGGALLAVAPWLPTWFSTDPAVQDAIWSLYPALVAVQVIGGAVFAWDGIVIGATDFRWAMIATAIPSAVATMLLVPVAVIDGTIATVWWIIVLMMVLRAGILGWWHRTHLIGRIGT